MRIIYTYTGLLKYYSTFLMSWCHNPLLTKWEIRECYELGQQIAFQYFPNSPYEFGQQIAFQYFPNSPSLPLT
jgi:hypothetical protein